MNQENPNSTEEKFNNTDVYSQKNDYSSNNYETNDRQVDLNVINDDDIKEELPEEAVLENKDEKDKSGSLHNYTSSQTFGLDNSVNTYNLDFYDYVEEVDNID